MAASTTWPQSEPVSSEQQGDSSTFCLLSWNIDGLDDEYTVERARAVCQFVKAKQPHAVYLQEVIDLTWDAIVKELGSTYHCISARSLAGYYVATLVQKTTTGITGQAEILHFPSSMMGRSLLQVPIRFAGVDICLLNSHLESMNEVPCVQERVAQLKTSFGVMEVMCERQPQMSCVFAGDLNLLDEDVEKVDIPSKVRDVWEACGSPPTQQHTWDPLENDNRKIPDSFRCRLDRVYIMIGAKGGLQVPPSHGAGSRSCGFVLVGKTRLSECGGRFPSDHWGLWVEFGVQSS